MRAPASRSSARTAARSTAPAPGQVTVDSSADSTARSEAQGTSQPPVARTLTQTTGLQPARASTSDVLVVGAGMIGAAAAWQALRAGLSVTCLDPTPGAGASFAAAGILSPVTEATLDDDALTQLRVASAALWPAFAADLVEAAHTAGDTATDVGFATRGTLAVGYDESDSDQLGRLHALHGRLGLHSEVVTVAEAREREPALAPHLACALWVAGDHQVDPRAVHRALQAVLAADPRALLMRSGASTLLLGGDGRAIGVIDAHGGLHHAGTIVLAAGTASSRLVAATGRANLPVQSITGQTLRLRPSGGATLAHVVRGTVQMRPIYVVPRSGGEIVVGSTSDGPAAAASRGGSAKHDGSTKQGGSASRGGSARHGRTGGAGLAPVGSAGDMFDLLRDARSLVPSIDEQTFVEVTNRGRPGTPDNLPLIGETGVPGLLAATGHSRNGILLTPLTAAALGTLFGGTPAALPELTAMLAPADPRRFGAEATPWTSPAT